MSSLHESRWKVIAYRARCVQLELWNQRRKLWEGSPPDNPLQVLQPSVALHSKGFRVEIVDWLDDPEGGRRRTEIAGELDRGKELVRVSSLFPFKEQTFTLAHELGHVMLHPDAERVHRDRPLDPFKSTKSQQEREADWFAACFLMPERHVRAQFVQSFRTEQFVLTDDSSFSLFAKPFADVMEAIHTVRDLAFQLARAIAYDNRRIPQLSSIFGVSDLAMAIRLEELGLIAPIPCWPRAKRRQRRP